MHAVFTVVELEEGNRDKAVQALQDNIVPLVKQAPGFVKAAWFGDDGKGHGVVLFETEEQARQAVQEVGSRPSPEVRVVSSEVYSVHAEA